MSVNSMPSASSGRLAIIEEVTYGVTPAGNLQEIGFNSETLQKQVNNVESEMIDSGEMVTEVKKVGVGAQGDISMEMVLDNDDLFLQGLMKNSYDTYSITGSDMSIVATGNKIVSSYTDFSLSLDPGMFVKVEGFSNNDFNRPIKIISVAEHELVVAGMTLVNESAGASITISGKKLTNGVTLRSFSIEKSFKDQAGSDVFFKYLGACVNSLNISMPQEDKITLGYNIMAKDEELSDTTIGTGYIEKVSGEMMDSANNIVYALLGNSEIVPSAISALNIENNLRMQKGVGSKYLIGIGKGKQRVSGTLEMYFSSKALYNKFSNNTEDTLDIVIQNSDGSKWMVLSIPRVKYTTHPVNLSGTEADILSSVEFTGIKDPDKAYQIAIFKQND